MEINHRTRGSTTIICMHGRWVCDYHQRTDLRSYVKRLIEAGRLDLVLDLSGVTFADSTVVGEIASTHVGLHRRGGRLTLLNPSTRMSRLLSVSRLASVIEVRRTDDSPASPIPTLGATRDVHHGLLAAPGERPASFGRRCIRPD